MRGVAGQSAPCTGIHAQLGKVMEHLNAERRTLETMIVEMFAGGHKNLGNNQKVLEQSRKLDQLIVDEMMLEEILKKASL